MTFQSEIGFITLIGLGLVTLAFIYVISMVGKPAVTEDIQVKAYALRRWLFLALVVFATVVTYASLRSFPIPKQGVGPQRVQSIDVIGHQWYWELSQNRITTGIPVEFRVTSADVNHGFALYAPDDRLVTQTQAMPGYTNRLVHTFDQPGKYRVLCLEYCGLAHHAMITEFEVVTPATGDQP